MHRKENMMPSSDNQIYDDLAGVIQSVFDLYGGTSYIRSGQIPDLDLYVDQITTFLSQHLEKNSRFPDEKVMTKTMINNYTKNKLLPPPQKKKYSGSHMILLILIYYFKSYLSITDIQTILKPLTEYYFKGESDLALSEVYDRMFSNEDALLEAVSSSIDKELSFSQTFFEDVDDEHKDYLDRFALICTLSLDIYLRKKIVEQLIDTMPEHKD